MTAGEISNTDKRRKGRNINKSHTCHTNQNRNSLVYKTESSSANKLAISCSLSIAFVSDKCALLILCLLCTGDRAAALEDKTNP
mmetsp:Transcript_30840/g.52872  ORF Transcript_30840/g.52872 Transcript_30840/m.52872 type:complete len:84 (-) Transcript_30840:242-493(-)